MRYDSEYTTEDKDRGINAGVATQTGHVVSGWIPRLTPATDDWMESLDLELYIDLQPDSTLPDRLTNPLYGRTLLDDYLQERAYGAPDITSIRQTTQRLPSFVKLLAQERTNE